MKNSLLYISLISLFLLTGCDYFSGSDSGQSSGGTETVTTAVVDNSQSPPPPDSPSQPEQETPTATSVTLSAFSDFDCNSNWATRDGAIGLVANSGSGSCQAVFQGVSSKYRVTITVQTEFDGRPHYILYINGETIASGRYDLSNALACDCPLDDWRSVCPDKKMELNAGTHTIAKGDIIKFYGQEDWECDEHGAYAKWHGISFEPVK